MNKYISGKNKILNCLKIVSSLCVLTVATGCGEAGFTGPPIQFSGALPLSAGDWGTITHSGRDMILQDSGGVLSFEFPVGKEDNASESINYLYSGGAQPRNISQTKYLSITIKVQTLSGNPVYQYTFGDKTNTCLDPAKVHVLLWDSEKQNEDQARWFANETFILRDGVGSLKVPLTIEHWSDVLGGRDPIAFSKTLAHTGWIGLTFGGGCFAGHGVNIRNGRVKFSVISYSVNA